MDNEINLDQWCAVRWEKPTDTGIRYYEVRLHQDLWGGVGVDQNLGPTRERRGYNLVPYCA